MEEYRNKPKIKDVKTYIKEKEVYTTRKELQEDITRYLEDVIVKTKKPESLKGVRQLEQIKEGIEDKQIKIAELEEFLFEEQYKKPIAQV